MMKKLNCIKNTKDAHNCCLFLFFIIYYCSKESKESKGEVMDSNFLKNVKISKKGQVTIPAEIRNLLGVQSGDYITFGVSEQNVVIVNRKKIKIKNEKGKEGK